MKNLFRKNIKRKSIWELKGASVLEEEANRMNGGFKEYKPTIYSTYNFSHQKSKLSHLFSGTEEDL